MGLPPTTAVPQILFTDQGPIIPSDGDVLAGVQEDMNYAFGGGLNPGLSTPQGQLASSEAAIISDKNDEIAEVCNQIDPQYATGRFQDAIGRIYFMERKPATSTVVACTLTGLPGTVVPAGVKAQDTGGNQYVLLGAVTISAGGTVMSSWTNIATGPIPCPSGTLIQVYQSVPGWDAITNPADGVLGQNVESPAEFEFRREQSVALNGRGTTQAVNAAVFGVAGVLDCYVIDNPAGITVDKGSTNYPLAPHSLYVAVVGGVATDVAAAIWGKKDVGCDYAPHPVGGSPVPGDGTVVTETVTDDSGYEFPQPSYQVSYLTPGALPIYFNVQIVNNPNLPANIVTLVRNAIIAQFNGTNGGQRARIGSLILATGFFAAIAGVASNVMLISVGVGTTAMPTGTSVQVGIDQAPTLSAGNIAVTLV